MLWFYPRGSAPVMSQPSPKPLGGVWYHIPLISVCCNSGIKALFRPIRVFGAGVLNDPLNVTGEKNGQSLNLAWAGLWQQGENLIECGGFKRHETWWPFPVFWRADSIALLKMLIPNGSHKNRSSEKTLGVTNKRLEEDHKQRMFRGHCVKMQVQSRV